MIELHLKIKKKKIEFFFDYLFLIFTTLQTLPPVTRETQTPQKPRTKYIIDLIKEELSLVIDFFKQGKRVTFIYENKGHYITFEMVEKNVGETIVQNVRGTITQYRETLPAVSFPQKILPLVVKQNFFYRGMCDPHKNMSLPKISQHCEYLYSKRRDNVGGRDKVSLCRDRIDTAKTRLANTYLSNCTNRLEDPDVPISGGNYRKRKRRKTHRKKKSCRKKIKGKTRKNKSPFLYR
jgi:hypothetical protein